MFVPGIDWQKERQIIPTCGRGRPKYTHFMTTNCFKRYCVRSQSPNAKHILDYFGYVESKYREYKKDTHTDKRRREQRQLEQMTPEEREAYQEQKEIDYMEEMKHSPLNTTNLPDGDEYVYVIAIKSPNHQGIIHKIGRTQHFYERMRALRSDFKNSMLALVHVVNLPSHVIEKCVHFKLNNFNLKHESSIEIFEARLADIISVIDECKQELIYGQYCASSSTQTCTARSCTPTRREVFPGILPVTTWGNEPGAIADNRRKLKSK